MIYSLFKEEKQHMLKPEIQEYLPENVAQESVDAHAEADQQTVWLGVYNHVTTGIERILQEASALEGSNE